jgi:acyl homoserine lactone synthase
MRKTGDTPLPMLSVPPRAERQNLLFLVAYKANSTAIAFIPRSHTDQRMNAMLQFRSGTRQQLPPQLFEQMGQYRREVFINRLGWELNIINGMELDEFDGPDAVYVCSQDDEGNVNGVARLLPTTGPYLMEKVFPQLWGGNKLPHDPQIWELSRFAMVDTAKTAGVLPHQASAATASALLCQVIHAANANGANSLITVSPVGVERLLRVNRFNVQRAGTPSLHHNHILTALKLNLTGRFSAATSLY